MNPTFIEAQKWFDRGIAVVPTFPRSKRSVVKWKRYQSELPSIVDLVQWFHRPGYNLAVICGWQNLTILDFDDIIKYAQFVYDYPEYEGTYTVQSARGMHVYVYCENAKTKMSSDLDIKNNGYCLAPPSIHPSGKPYRVAIDKAIMRIAELPLSPGTVKGSNSGYTSNCTRRLYPQNSIINRIKNAYPITQLFQPVKIFDNGMAFAHCPTEAHPNGDRDPSLSLNLITDRCQCISRSECPLHSAHGNDVIDTYRILHELSFKQALAAMAAELNL